MTQKKNVSMWIVGIFIILFFPAGIIAANLWFPAIGTELHSLNSYLSFDASGWNRNVFFFYLLFQRLPCLIIMILFLNHRLKPAVYSFIGAWQSFSIGYLAAASILNFSLRGILVFLRLLFPHYIFYIAVFFLMLRKKGASASSLAPEKPHSLIASNLLYWLLIGILFLAGILTEEFMTILFL